MNEPSSLPGGPQDDRYCLDLILGTIRTDDPDLLAFALRRYLAGVTDPQGDIDSGTLWTRPLLRARMSDLLRLILQRRRPDHRALTLTTLLGQAGTVTGPLHLLDPESTFVVLEDGTLVMALCMAVEGLQCVSPGPGLGPEDQRWLSSALDHLMLLLRTGTGPPARGAGRPLRA